MTRKRIKVAGKIDFYFGEPLKDSSTETDIILNELTAYLHCFLDGVIYLDDRQKTAHVIKEMLIDAQLIENHLFFSFPTDITRQFLLKKRYEMPLVRGAAFKIYNDQWMPQKRLSCHIVVHEESPLYNDIVRRLREIIMQSGKRPLKIVIGRNRQTQLYDIRITFIRNTHKMVRDAAQTIDDAVSLIASHLH